MIPTCICKLKNHEFCYYVSYCVSLPEDATVADSQIQKLHSQKYISTFNVIHASGRGISHFSLLSSSDAISLLVLLKAQSYSFIQEIFVVGLRKWESFHNLYLAISPKSPTAFMTKGSVQRELSIDTTLGSIHLAVHPL